MANKKITLGNSSNDIQVTFGSTNTMSGTKEMAIGENNTFVSGGDTYSVICELTPTSTSEIVISETSLTPGGTLYYTITDYVSSSRVPAATALFYSDRTVITGSVLMGTTAHSTLAIPAGTVRIGFSVTSSSSVSFTSITLEEKLNGNAKNALSVGSNLQIYGGNSIVCGEYNEPNAEHLFEIGGGTSSDRKNIFAVSKKAVRLKGSFNLEGNMKIIDFNPRIVAVDNEGDTFGIAGYNGTAFWLGATSHGTALAKGTVNISSGTGSCAKVGPLASVLRDNDEYQSFHIKHAGNDVVGTLTVAGATGQIAANATKPSSVVRLPISSIGNDPNITATCDRSGFVITVHPGNTGPDASDTSLYKIGFTVKNMNTTASTADIVIRYRITRSERTSE